MVTQSLFAQTDSSDIPGVFSLTEKVIQKGPACKRGVFDTLLYFNTIARYKADHVIIWNMIDTQFLRSYDLYKSDSNLKEIYFRTDYLTDTSCQYSFHSFKHYQNYLTGSISLAKSIEIKKSKKPYVEYLNFKDGYLNGDYALYYPNGSPAVMGFYYQGVRSGLWQFYHDNGRLLSKGYYENDTKTIIPANEGQLAVYGKGFQFEELIPENEASLLYQRTMNSTNPTSFPAVLFFRKGKWDVYNDKGILIRKQKFRYGKLVTDKEIFFVGKQ